MIPNSKAYDGERGGEQSEGVACLVVSCRGVRNTGLPGFLRRRTIVSGRSATLSWGRQGGARGLGQEVVFTDKGKAGREGSRQSLAHLLHSRDCPAWQNGAKGGEVVLLCFGLRVCRLAPVNHEGVPHAGEDRYHFCTDDAHTLRHAGVEHAVLL